MSPKVVSDRFNRLMDRLGYSYLIHGSMDPRTYLTTIAMAHVHMMEEIYLSRTEGQWQLVPGFGAFWTE